VKSGNAKSSKRPPSHVGQNIGAWMLLTLGLAGIVGGGGMIYINSIAPIDPTAPRNSNIYLIAGAWIVAGVVLTLWGAGMRRSDGRGHSSPLEKEAKGSAKRSCAACSGVSPPTATRCYHCGASL
jgi:hypothetical protein